MVQFTNISDKDKFGLILITILKFMFANNYGRPVTLSDPMKISFVSDPIRSLSRGTSSKIGKWKTGV